MAVAAQARAAEPHNPGIEIPLAHDALTLRVVDNEGDVDFARREMEAVTGQPIESVFAHRLYFTGNMLRHAIVMLHRVSPTREAEMLVYSRDVIWTRGILRELARTVFVTMGARRIVARIPSTDDTVRDLAKRAGFTFEGLSLDYFGPGTSAATYAMTAGTCRWLSNKDAA